MSLPEDTPEPSDNPDTPTPVSAPPATAAPAPTAARPPRPRWRKWLIYSLAGFGALAVVLVLLVVVLVIHHEHSLAPGIDRDAQVDASMTGEYGKYSESDKGWLYVEPNTKTTYLMQVIQRAKIDLPDTTVKGNTALYFVASGAPLGGTDQGIRLLGLFVIQPDKSTADGALIQLNEPFLMLDSRTTVAPQDVRFEALSKDTWGWVIKVTRDPGPRSESVRIDNRLYAPHGEHIERLATFPASGHYTQAQGCITLAAVQADAAKREASTASAAASAASLAASGVVADSEPGGEEDESGLEANCVDASWAYRTGALPAEGFVEFLLTGGGTVDGVQIPVRTVKMVFDPKSFTYVVPNELQAF